MTRQEMIDYLHELAYREREYLSVVLDGIEGPCAIAMKLEEAAGMLKEQEPRVLSYEQIKGIVEGVVWVELNGREVVEPWIVHQGKIWRPDYNIGYEHWDVSKEDEYNRIVRCWTAKPSYEQRKAVKWG